MPQLTEQQLKDRLIHQLNHTIIDVKSILHQSHGIINSKFHTAIINSLVELTNAEQTLNDY